MANPKPDTNKPKQPETPDPKGPPDTVKPTGVVDAPGRKDPPPPPPPENPPSGGD